jgi:hypothetical protein
MKNRIPREPVARPPSLGEYQKHLNQNFNSNLLALAERKLANKSLKKYER